MLVSVIVSSTANQLPFDIDQRWDSVWKSIAMFLRSDIRWVDDAVCVWSQFGVFFFTTLDGAVHSLIAIACSCCPENKTAEPVWQYITNHKLIMFLCLCSFFYYLTGFFDHAKSDFQQALKLNPDFEDAKVSLQQTLLDQQHKINRGYWQLHKL